MKTADHGKYPAGQESFVKLKANIDQLLRLYGIKRDVLLVRNIDHEIANLETILVLAREFDAPPDPDPGGPDGPPPTPPPDKPPGGDN